MGFIARHMSEDVEKSIICFGTVSHGTLRTQDLLNSFGRELERIFTQMGAYGFVASEKPGSASTLAIDCFHYAATLSRWVSGGRADDDAQEVLDRAFEVLNDFAPDGYHFGAHEGDGSDFGFWPNEEEDDLHAGDAMGRDEGDGDEELVAPEVGGSYLSAADVQRIVLREGLGYAVTSYIGAAQIVGDGELKRMWAEAEAVMLKIRAHLDGVKS